MAQAARGHDCHPSRGGPRLDRLADRLAQRVRAGRAGLVGWIAGVLEDRQDRTWLIVEQALDDEGEAVRQALLVLRGLTAVVKLAVAGRVAPGDLPPGLLGRVGHV